MDIKSLIEKRNKLMVDAQAVITKETVTTEDRSNFDRMISDADVLSADITRMQSVENFNKEQNRSTRPPRAGFGNDDKSEETVKNQKRAFTEWMRTGQVSAENRQYLRTNEQRDLVCLHLVARLLAGRFWCLRGLTQLSTLHSRATDSCLMRSIR